MREEIHVEGDTVDVRLARLRPVGGPPVVLVPGLGANARAYDLHPPTSLATSLERAGFTPWSLEFHVGWLKAGQCASSLLRALEGALQKLDRAVSASDGDVRAVGHSLGGILLLALAAEGFAFRSIVTLGTGLDHRLGHADLKHVLRFVRLRGQVRGRALALGGFPLKGPARLLAPAFGRGVSLPLELDQFHPGSTDGALVRGFFREGVVDMPVPLLLDLSGLFHAQGLRIGPDPRPLRERVGDLSVPTLLVAGRQDRQCPVGSVRDTAARIDGSRLLELGSDGKGEGYGHMDLLLGRESPREVFEPVCAFLQEEDLCQPVGSASR